MSKLWEHMSRDEKLDFIKEQLEDINATLTMFVKHYNELNAHLSQLTQKQEEKQ